jgi:alkanesulfonate monooxygenase SsuD/methylene tetrahydromethanopterin reductase-like flavin-dependent oxidoreductase (luciferase family)
MRVVSTMIRISATSSPDGGLMDRITNFARQVEARGFPGVWIGDSLGRRRSTLDSLQVLTALAAVTSKVEFGISVLQLPLPCTPAPMIWPRRSGQFE